MRVVILALALPLFLVTGTADISTTTLHPPSEPTAPQPFPVQPDIATLHRMITDSFDHGKYGETAQLLRYLKVTYPDRYESLPYALLYARAAIQADDLGTAVELYGRLAQDTRLSRYAVLPLARIAVKQGKIAEAIRQYQTYLSHPDYPGYPMIALEALHYCAAQKRADDLMTTARIASGLSSTQRMAGYFMAKATLMKGDRDKARRLLLDIVRSGKHDDATSLALSELDALDGSTLVAQDLASRGRLAYSLWNFELARKYLQPVALNDIKNSYYYARALYFLGDHAGAKASFERAIAQWPNDSWTRLCREQYANVCLRDGDEEKAEEILRQLRNSHSSDTANYRLIQLLRAQSRFEEALRSLEPSTNSRDRVHQARAIFLRGRIHYQQGLYREAYADFDLLLKSRPRALDLREVEYWKALMLEKMKYPQEALRIYSSLSERNDFFGALARDKIPATNISSRAQSHECAFPEAEEGQILAGYHSGTDAPAFLYLHLYEELAASLNSTALVKSLALSDDPRPVRLLEMAHMTGLARDYPSANYYSELFMKAVPNLSAVSTSEDTLRILFPWAYRDIIEKFATERGIDPLLVLAIMRQESRFKPMARSGVFARGLMQLIPTTAANLASSLGLEEFSPEQLYFPEVNVNLGTRYIQEMVRQFGNRTEVLAAAYNGGETNTRVWLSATSTQEPIEFFSNIDFAQTRDYVKQVRIFYDWYKRTYGKR